MNYTKYIVAVLVLIAIAGAYFYPESLPTPTPLGVASSTAGATNNDAKRVSIAMAPISAAATSTSILNSDATDRIVIDAGVTCTGLTNMFGSDSAGLVNYRWTAGTSSVAAPTASVINATLAAMNVTVATTTPDGFTATSTYTNPYARRWNAGSYMVFQTTGTSSAAACTPYLSYVAS